MLRRAFLGLAVVAVMQGAAWASCPGPYACNPNNNQAFDAIPAHPSWTFRNCWCWTDGVDKYTRLDVVDWVDGICADGVPSACTGAYWVLKIGNATPQIQDYYPTFDCTPLEDQMPNMCP
jgi:hypothetical protein